ncbi:MAG TPA: molybdenum cofactor guanylyltransferase [bacterium]|nr:molybdenum cofactor guanylyltransferase [bacterium]
MIYSGHDAPLTPRMLTGVVLSGGQSRRMGRNKAFLPAGPGTLIEVVIGHLRQACDDLLLVTTTPEEYQHLGLRTVRDALPPGQSLVGIYTGILYAGGPAFICACDMPFLNPALIRHMASLVHGADVVIPLHEGLYEPLHAVYTPVCLDPIRRCVERRGRNTDFLPDVRVRAVEPGEVHRFDPDMRSFVNLNTPEEYAEALKLLSPA